MNCLKLSFLVSILFISCDPLSDNANNGLKPSITPNASISFPLVVNNQWTYVSTSTNPTGSANNHDTISLRVTGYDADTFHFLEIFTADSSIHVSETTFYDIYAKNSYIIFKSGSSRILQSLCLTASCTSSVFRDTADSVTQQYSNGTYAIVGIYDLAGYQYPGTMSFNDLGQTPVDGCGGIRIFYSPDYGIISREDYCGWNVSTTWNILR